MKRTAIVSLLIFLVTFIVFFPVYRNDFVDFDDLEYITENPHVATGPSIKNIIWAFTNAHAHNWHPLTWVSHMVDVELFGLDPTGHHLVGAFIHAINAALAFMLVSRLTGAITPAAFLALFFALHPLRVESVAWAAERKDVLATFFFLSALLAYAAYARKGKIAFYLTALFLHASGLMAKQMGVTLPFILLLLDYWPLKRLVLREAWKKIAWEKMPFFVLSVGAGITVYIIQKKTGVLHGEALFPLDVRIANALYSTVAYLGKIFWPTDLAVFYPHPLNTISPIALFLSALAIIAITMLALFGTRPYLQVGWFWFLISLLPILGIIQVGIQGMADRYTYLPSLGIFITVVFGAKELAERWKKLKAVFLAAGVIAVATLSVLTVKQIGVWRSSFTLYAHAVQATQENYWAYNNLGAVLYKEGKAEEAKQMFLRALSILPEYPGANKNLAAILFQEGKYRDALFHVEKALQVQPTNPEYLTAKGAILLKMGDPKGARAAFHRALKFAPNYPEAMEGLREAEKKP